MSTDPKFQAAIETEIVWKNDELKNFCVELVKRALASDAATFTTDLVPDAVRGSGLGIAGSAANILKTAHVIEPVGVFHGGKFYPEKVLSQREGRNSSAVSVYRLLSVNIAREFLRRHSSSAAAPMQQPEFFTTRTELAQLR